MIIGKPINKSLDQILEERAKAYMKAANKDAITISFRQALREVKRAYEKTGKAIRKT